MINNVKGFGDLINYYYLCSHIKTLTITYLINQLAHSVEQYTFNVWVNGSIPLLFI